MSSMEEFAKDPQHRRQFEKLLYLAAQRGDADLVAERLGWGVDPNCTSKKGRTPLMANVCKSSPSAATVRVLLQYGADPTITDQAGLTALDYARRKLLRFGEKRPRPQKSPSKRSSIRFAPIIPTGAESLRNSTGKSASVPPVARSTIQNKLNASSKF
jgi:hypothetical protein